MKKQFKIPHTFTIVFFIVVLAAVATWVVPSGEFVRESVLLDDGSTKEVVVPDSYHALEESSPQTWQVFSAFFNGFLRTSNIIAFIFIIGGAFWIFNHTRAIDVGVGAFLSLMGKMQNLKLFKNVDLNKVVIICIMLLFSLFGAIFGMSEETIAFVIIFIPLAISMGYDSIVGMAMCYLAAHVGFTGAMTNPFTIGIAQGLAELPTFSGLEYRFICWLIFTALGIFFVLMYAAKVKKNPKFSPMYKLDNYWRERNHPTNVEKIEIKKNKSSWVVFGALLALFVYLSIEKTHTKIDFNNAEYVLPIIPVLGLCFLGLGVFSLRKGVQFFILNLLLFTVIFLVVGVLGYGWEVMEIATLFLVMGISAGLAYGTAIDTIFKLFLEGCKDILNAALIVGLAGGIIVILNEGKIIDTLLFSMANSLKDVGQTGSLAMMYLFQNLLNLIIPSGSAKAALTIPIMAPFSDIIQISRQTMVLAFQFGDGITNMITPASGVLLGCLGVAKIPYAIWAKWIIRFILLLFAVGFLLLWLTLLFNFNGF
ncbi:MAG: AbgT family transporter [Lentimicrobiaceae bacterium]|nr:AbgT family transporter [Lentimicrobiaceae bacterium]